MTDQHDDLKDKLIHAYDNMMENLHALYERAEKGTEDMQELLKKARDDVANKDNITREDADKVSHFLKRDLHHASEYLDDSRRDLGDWLHMDIELLEWNIADLFLQVADNTKLNLLLLEENAKHINEYHTGEITGPGLLVCNSCHEKLHFSKTGHIPPCPKCHATLYTRQSREQ